MEDYRKNPKSHLPEFQPTEPGAGVKVWAGPTVVNPPGTVKEAHQQSTSEAEAQGGPGNESY